MMENFTHRFHEGWLSPTVLLTILFAVSGQIGLSIWWARGESARITAAEVATMSLRSDVYSLNTPLAKRVAEIEIRQTELMRQLTALTLRIDGLDAHGTRGLENVTQNQQRNINQIERMAERMLTMDRRLSDIDSRVQAYVDQASTAFKRVDERMDKVVQALDNLYSTVMDYFRQQEQRPERRQR